MKTSASVVTLTTDFGLADPYVGQMKATLCGLAPTTPIVDLCHELPSHDIRSAAFVLESSFPYTPANSVHLCVVDPGVGGDRDVLAASCRGHRFLAPDNGALDRVVARHPIDAWIRVDADRWRLEQVATTFDGRDLFAPLAAQLLNGVTIEALGTAAALPTPDRPQPLLPGEQRSVEIVWVDRFGNLVVDLHRDQLKDGAPESLVVQSGDVQISGLRRDYQAPDGRPFAVIGSSGYLEIACRERSAATTLGRGVGDSINVARPGSASTKGS